MAETFKNQVDALTGFAGTEDDALSDWLTSGAKEIVNVLPSELKEKCMTETTLNNSSQTMDLDGVGKILYVSRLSADSGGYRVSCREVPSMHAGLTSDSSNLLYYGTVTDPVYWIQSTSDAAILNVYPSPEATQTARVYHISYPTVVYNDATITNFPDEVEYIVVLYAACKALQSTMGGMQASIVHSDQDGTYTAPTSLDVSGGTGSQGWEQVRYWLEVEEDTEMSGATMSSLSGEMQQFVTEYQWYQGQYKMLKQDYASGMASLGMAKGQMAGSETR